MFGRPSRAGGRRWHLRPRRADGGADGSASGGADGSASGGADGGAGGGAGGTVAQWDTDVIDRSVDETDDQTSLDLVLRHAVAARASAQDADLG
jgi:hypothetical protein